MLLLQIKHNKVPSRVPYYARQHDKMPFQWAKRNAVHQWVPLKWTKHDAVPNMLENMFASMCFSVVK